MEERKRRAQIGLSEVSNLPYSISQCDVTSMLSCCKVWL